MAKKYMGVHDRSEIFRRRRCRRKFFEIPPPVITKCKNVIFHENGCQILAAPPKFLKIGQDLPQSIYFDPI